MTKFYVYGHYRNDTNEIFYIGKGFAERAYHKYGRSEHWTRIVNKYGYAVKILARDLEEDIAHEMEVMLIKKYGRLDLKTGPLINRTNGGEGVIGYTHTDANKKIIGERSIGRTKSELVKQLISQKLQGHAVSNETKEKLRQANLGKKQSAETIEKRTAHLRGENSPNYMKYGSANGRSKPVTCFTLSGFTKQFESAGEGARWAGLANPKTISKCCLGAKCQTDGEYQGERLYWSFSQNFNENSIENAKLLRPYSKRVACFAGDFYLEFDTVSAGAKYFNMVRSCNISLACKDHKKTSGVHEGQKLHWKYI